MSEPLHDPRPGALGFLETDDGEDIGAACLMLFQEPDASIPPVDTAGQLERVSADTAAGMGWPRVVLDGFTGPARSFSGRQGLVAEDPRAATFLAQSVTVQAIVRWNRDAQAAAGEPGTLVSRGLGTEPAQRRCFHVQLRAGATPGAGIIELGWQAPGLPLVVYEGAAFDHRDGWYLFTATREYHSPAHIIVRYWRNAELLAEHHVGPVLPSRIAGGVATGKVFLLGAAGDGAGGYERYLHGDIDSLVVRPYAVTHEQVAALYRRLTYFQPQIDRAVRDLLPPGRAPSRDPASIAQGIAKATAQPFALAASLASELAESGLPPHCYGARLRQWERCLELPDALDASIYERRARVQAALRRELGLSADALRQGLAPLLGIEPEDIELITMTNLVEDPFDAPLDDLRWQIRGNGSASVDAGALVLRAALGADIRHGPNLARAPTCRATVAEAAGATLIWQLEDLAAPDGTEAGMLVQAGRDALWWTVRQELGARVLGHRVLRAGELSAFVPALSGIPLPVWLRIEIAGDTSGTVRVSHSHTGPYTGYAAPVEISFSSPVAWAGATLKADKSTLPAAAAARFGHAILWTPNADRPFSLYAYRDPSLPGRYDLHGARVQLDRQRAARDTASAGTVRALVCDDPDHGCDQAPLGGYE